MASPEFSGALDHRLNALVEDMLREGPTESPLIGYFSLAAKCHAYTLWEGTGWSSGIVGSTPADAVKKAKKDAEKKAESAQEARKNYCPDDCKYGRVKLPLPIPEFGEAQQTWSDWFWERAHNALGPQQPKHYRSVQWKAKAEVYCSDAAAL